MPPVLPAVVKSELKDLLALSPVLLSDFEKAFAKRFGRTFQYMQYGFFSLFEVLNAASDVISVEQTRAGSLLMLKKSVSEEKRRGWLAGKHVSISNCFVDQQILERLWPIRWYVMAKPQKWLKLNHGSATCQLISAKLLKLSKP